MPHPKPDLEKNGSVFLFLYARRHPAHPVSVLVLHSKGLQALWSLYDTEMIMHRNAVKGVDNAMPCHRNVRNPATQVH